MLTSRPGYSRSASIETSVSAWSGTGASAGRPPPCAHTGRLVQTWTSLISPSTPATLVGSVATGQGVPVARERGGLVRSWDHTLSVTPVGEHRSRYRDRVVIDAGPLTPVVTTLAVAVVVTALLRLAGAAALAATTSGCLVGPDYSRPSVETPLGLVELDVTTFPGFENEFGAGRLTIQLQGRGLGEDVALITDGRFSGVSHGILIGHISPEAAKGGPIAAVRDGDIIVIDPKKRTLDLDVSAAEIARRMAGWKAPDPKVRPGPPAQQCLVR